MVCIFQETGGKFWENLSNFSEPPKLEIASAESEITYPLGLQKKIGSVMIAEWTTFRLAKMVWRILKSL